MPETDDMQLLREFTAHNSQDAFTALVQRHINLVYSVALRHVRDAQQAQDVTQAVFIILTQKAARLREDTVLSGWLYRTARFASASFLRGERRRQRREQQAFMQSTIDVTPPEPTWQQLAPVLDDAMARLGETERNALVLRFFEGRTLAEVALALNLNEPAAKKRVARAVEKLRRFFVKRGIAVSAGVLAATLGANSVQAAPAGLATTISGLALAKGSAVGLSTLTLIQGTLKLIAWAKVQTAVSVGAVALLAVGAATTAVQVVHSSRPAARPDIQGAWEVAAGAGPARPRLVLRISQERGTYRASADLPDLGLKEVPVDKLVYRYPSVHVEHKAIGLVYDATLSASGEEMSGVGKWNGHSGPFTLKRTAAPAYTQELLTEAEYAPRPDSDVQGYWKGALKAGSTLYPLVLKIAEPAKGTFRAEWNSVERGVKDLPASAVSYERPNLKIEFAGIGGLYQGVLSRGDSQIVGTWNIRGQIFPVTFQRASPLGDQVEEAAKDYSYTRPTDLQGHWHATLTGNERHLQVALDIARQPDGAFSASIASRDLGTFYAATRAVDFSPPAVRMEWKGVGSAFAGELKDGKLSGTLYLGRSTHPVVFERSGPGQPAQ